jgi:hypothetical protein
VKPFASYPSSEISSIGTLSASIGVLGTLTLRRGSHAGSNSRKNHRIVSLRPLGRLNRVLVLEINPAANPNT